MIVLKNYTLAERVFNALYAFIGAFVGGMALVIASPLAFLWGFSVKTYGQVDYNAIAKAATKPPKKQPDPDGEEDWKKRHKEEFGDED
jgi:hypothetical protein